MKEYSLSEYDAKVLSKERPISDYFEEVLSYGSDVSLTVNFVTTSILSTLNKLEISLEDLFITPKMLSGVVDFVHEGKISLDHGKKILYQALEQKIDPVELIKKENLQQISDEDTLLELITSIMDENKEQVRQYIEEDNEHVVNFFIGQTMKKSNRQANPNVSLELIKKELERRKQDAK